MLPASSVVVTASHRDGGNDTSDVASAAAITSVADVSPNASAETIRAVKRAAGDTGRMRRNVCHGDARSAAIPTPNWKNATPSTAKAAYDAIARSSGSSSRRPNARKITVRKRSVGTLKLG